MPLNIRKEVGKIGDRILLVELPDLSVLTRGPNAQGKTQG